jgi:chitin disaccharide deacetylase
MSSRQLIVNADDFGFDEDTCEQTEALMLAGIVRSATLMTGMPASARALAFARQHQGTLSFGLHFNIAEGRPQGPRPAPSLVDLGSGEFHGPFKQRLRCLGGLARPEEVAAELEHQLSRLADQGLKLSHVDSHGHLHKFPAVAAAMLPVLGRHGIRRMRRPQNIYQRGRPLTRLLNRYCSARFPNISTTDHCCGIEAPDADAFARMLRALPTGRTELACHPGLSEAWRRDETTLLRDQLPQLLAQNGIANISFHDL